jgi:hypothetical protein
MNDDAVNRKQANEETTLRCLMSALDEAHASIRAYDTKAQIVGIGFIFSIGVLSNLLGKIDIVRDFDLPYLIVGFLVLIGPVILFGAVLFPSRIIAPSTGTPTNEVTYCYYYRSDKSGSLQDFIEKADHADWKTEIAYELIKVSLLRELKRKRFILALLSAAASFVFIVTATAIKMI